MHPSEVVGHLGTFCLLLSTVDSNMVLSPTVFRQLYSREVRFLDAAMLFVFVSLETPGSSYWKEVAEERRKALFSVLQENEKVS